MRIMLVDDISDFGDLKHRLELDGHDADIARDLAGAEQLLIDMDKSKPYGLIILDLDMDVYALDQKYREEASSTFAGWVFFKNVIPEYASELQKRTIFLTAYRTKIEEIIKAEGTNYGLLAIVEKDDNHMINEILKNISKIQ